MAARVPVAWLILLILCAVFAFFGYHIVNAASPSTEIRAPLAPQMVRREEPPQLRISETLPGEVNAVSEDSGAPVVHKHNPVPNRMPVVPGQTEEDLRRPEPLQRTPPSVQYDEPEAIDPLNRNVHMNSEFGSNLRHPEQMIESTHTNTGEEFMAGISAFDSAEMGSAFSLL